MHIVNTSFRGIIPYSLKGFRLSNVIEIAGYETCNRCGNSHAKAFIQICTKRFTETHMGMTGIDMEVPLLVRNRVF